MDFSAVCRTCLSTESLRPIFVSGVESKQRTAAVYNVTGIKIELDDGFPQKICTSCASYINSSLKFRKQCKDSETKLIEQTPSCDTKSTQKTNTNNKIEHVDDIKCEFDVLKTEIKCEFDAEPEMVQLRNEISDLTEKGNVESCDTSGKIESENERQSGLCKKKTVQRVSCPICQKDLSARSLRAHVASRHGAGAGLRCGFCKLEHGSREALASHAAECPMKKKRPDSARQGRELVSCDVCHKTLQRNSLRTHQAVKHKGLGPVCEHCGRRFGNKLRLSEHLRAKHGHDKLQCRHCDFQSSSNAALQNHERRHRGEKPFVCETCGAKFHAAYLLAQHRRGHTTEKRVKCGQCGATFKSSNNLHAHRAARHGARRHRCLLCIRVYSCRHYAVKHLRAVHGYKGTVPTLQVEPAPS